MWQSCLTLRSSSYRQWTQRKEGESLIVYLTLSSRADAINAVWCNRESESAPFHKPTAALKMRAQLTKFLQRNSNATTAEILVAEGTREGELNLFRGVPSSLSTSSSFEQQVLGTSKCSTVCYTYKLRVLSSCDLLRDLIFTQ